MNLKDIKGVGEKAVSLLNKLDIFNIEDLVNYYPFRYNFITLNKLDDCILNSGYINVLLMDSPKIFYFKKNFNRLTFRCICEGKIINACIFNRGFLKNNLKPGRNISLYGKYDKIKNNFVCSDILFDVITKSRIVPVYHLVKGISNKQMNDYICKCLENTSSVVDYIPGYLSDKYNFIDKMSALKEIHVPSNTSELKKAKLKLIYEELFIFMFKMNYLKSIRSLENNSIKKNIDISKVEEFINNLPFKLTEDQSNTVNDIYNDFSNNKRMNRLILGDVGSGKTIVSVIAIYMNYLAGYQSSLMVPTEVLANQHFESISKLLKGLKVVLLTGSTKSSDKKKILKELSDGNIDVLIGTHSLLNENVIFNNLGLVITDEQHRFGVRQRNIMQNKGEMVDVLYMSATPIPRTYALSLYGDMDLSMIKTKPSGRKEIITKVYKESELKEVLNKVLEELKSNHQVYVVAPLIEGEDGDDNLNDVYKLEENFKKAFLDKVNIAVLHGKMKKDEKNSTMQDFKDGKIKILISTTVIEVGVDVSNSTMMVIYNAERFGLATLHQLRGRVGRNDYQCYCYLIANQDIPRLKVLEESNDGFYISEKDFELRGEGDLFGVRQSGDMKFKLADINRDRKILLQCKNDSYEYINNFDGNPYYQEIIDRMQIHN